MNISIYCKEKLKEPHKSLFLEYKKRLSPYCRLDVKVAGKCLRALKESCGKNKRHCIVNVDANFPLVSSEELADKISFLKLNSFSDVSVLLGSCGEGVDADLEISIISVPISEALSISILSEQIFRAFTIINGRPYHK